MTCPWPEAEEKRRWFLRKTDRTFTYVQCAGCTRWFGVEHLAAVSAPTLCPWVCDPPIRIAPQRTKKLPAEVTQ